MSKHGRVRVSIPAVPLMIQPDAAEVSEFQPARHGELVTPLPTSGEDRAAGRRRYEVIVDGWRFVAAVEPAARAELRERAARAAAEHHDTARLVLRAQIPGRVARVWVGDGDVVEQGQRLLAVEAMKMENEIRAPRAGTVEDLRVSVGARVEREDELLALG